MLTDYNVGFDVPLTQKERDEDNQIVAAINP